MAGSSRVFESLPLRRPALQLPLDVAGPLGQVAEPDGIDVDEVELGQHVDEVEGHVSTHGRGQGGALVRAVEHDAIHVAHDVEGGAVDVGVGAEGEGGRDGHRGADERRDDAVLAGHVVGRGEDVAEGRPPEHDAPTGRIGDRVGEVGAAAGDQRERERRDGARHVRARATPRREPRRSP